MRAQKIKGSVVRLLAVGAVALGLAAADVGVDAAQAARQRNFTKTDSAAQSGYGGSAGATADNAKITADFDPFAFSQVGRIRRLERVVITATITDGDSGPGDSDVNKLFLALDGIDTGIALNGFRNNRTDTVTINAAPQSAGAIVRALQADGKLVATVVNRGNPGNLVTIPSSAQATLALKGEQR